MTMSFDGSELELRLHRRHAARAAYPLVLDPPISTAFALGVTSGDLDPAVAWSELPGRYLAVWSRRLSAVSAQVHAVLLDAAARPTTGLRRLDASGSALSAAPAVAHVAAAGAFAVVWQEAASPFGPWDLHARTVRADGTLSSTTRVTTAFANDHEAVLASEATTIDDDALLVWTRQGEGLRAAQLHLGTAASSTAPLVQLERLLVADPGATAPAISRSGGATGDYVVAWRSSAGGVDAMVVDRDFRLRSGVVTVQPGGAAAESPAVDGDGRRFLVAWQRQGLTSSDVHCRSLRWDGASLAQAATSTPIASSSFLEERKPAVAWLGAKFLLAWSVGGSQFLDDHVHMRTFAPDCRPCGDLHVARPMAGTYDTDPAIGAVFAGGGAGDEALVLFSSIDPASLATSIQAMRFEALGPGGSVVPLAGGCPGGGTASTVGPVAVGNLAFRYRLDGAHPTATFALFYLGLPDQVFACGPCTYIVQIVTVPVPIAGGRAEVGSPISCLLYDAVGASVDVQWITVGGSGAPCAFLPGISASNRLRITIGL